MHGRLVAAPSGVCRFLRLHLSPPLHPFTMVNLTKPCLLTILLALTPALAKTVGYFDADECIDPSGLEECYDAASSRYTDCVNVNCEGQNIDCINVCACVQTQGQIDCAASHCWDRVSSQAWPTIG